MRSRKDSMKIDEAATPINAFTNGGATDGTPILQSSSTEDKETLLVQIETRPTTSRRLVAVVDILLMIFVIIWLAVMKVIQQVVQLLRQVLKAPPPRLQVDDHTLEAFRNEVEALLTALQAGHATADELQDLSAHQPTDLYTTTDVHRNHNARDAMVAVRASVAALEEVCRDYSLELPDWELASANAAAAKLLEPLVQQPDLDCRVLVLELRNIYKQLLKRVVGAVLEPAVAKRLKQDFALLLLVHSAEMAPKVQRKLLMEVIDGTKGKPVQLVEQVCAVPLVLGASCLQVVAGGSLASEQLAFLQRHNTIRPSNAKSQKQVQAMPINARYHAIGILQDGEFRELYGEIRSGAFALHGTKPRGMGLMALKLLREQVAALPQPESDVLAHSAGFGSAAALAAAVTERQALVVSQAMPVVAYAIQRMCQQRSCLEGAWRSGCFLYGAQSMLTDMIPLERAMIQDIKGALDAVSQLLTIRFAPAPAPGAPATLPTVQSEGDELVLVLPTDCLLPPDGEQLSFTLEQFAQRSYRLRTLVFSQGVNSRQSYGFLFTTDTTMSLQDSINRESIERLLQYAEEAGLAQHSGIQALRQHYSSTGERSPKDWRGMRLIKDALLLLGGCRAVMCKSGKDRTGMEISWSLAAEAVHQGVVDTPLFPELLSQLQSGLSYITTATNNGAAPAYAFHYVDLAVLPAMWRPSWRLCGRVAT